MLHCLFCFQFFLFFTGQLHINGAKMNYFNTKANLSFTGPLIARQRSLLLITAGIENKNLITYVNVTKIYYILGSILKLYWIWDSITKRPIAGEFNI